MERFAEYLRKAESGLSIEKHLDNITDDPKERLKFWATFSVITQLEKTPFGLENIQEVLVWGDSNTDTRVYVEYKLRKGVPASQLSGFKLDHSDMQRHLA